MRTDSPLVLDVRELLEAHGVQHPLEFDAAVPDVGTALVDVPADVHFDLILEAIDGGVHTRATLSGEYEAECRRCLKRVKRPFAFRGSEIYRPSTDVWDEAYVIKDATVDLEPMARDTIVLNLPASPLCTDECKGLCSRCGADLNEGPCDCPEEIDMRWSALRELGGLNK